MKILKNEKGFTLIELVLIIVILGVLAAVATIQFGGILTDAKDSAVQGAAGSVNAQLALGINSIQALPDIAAGGAACVTDGSSSTYEDTVYNCITVSGDVTKSPLDATNAIFNICSGGLCSVADPPACDPGTERFVRITYTPATGALTITAPAACA